jgi:hypothetical protein
LVRAFPTWNARSMFAHIRPVSRDTQAHVLRHPLRER